MNLNPNHIGSDFDDFLKEEGILEEVSIIAVKRVLAWQITEAMSQNHINKRAMAEKMHTSRSQLDRLLDEQDGNLTLTTLVNAAKVLGKKINIELVPA
ncbi:MAG: Fis family transcriptional regulator [Polynucleobacter sp. 24-46-87]|jgi:predicted XRE-type DNA-binding protein|uniref:XRE family transcriptional regulator n=1 Tax=Hydrogenophaga sp. TaxID=1904254 RepID=UPI000BCDA06E|nr:XRE family transcriptional regulator [Hydrogenophaga sp.]MDP1959010.1 XRE family transcriptional regulator [Methylotenera sp.]MDP3885432.1 XRE family transcriptional regulator [Hydrogenophaga sp.]OZA10947.1 MAG: Fis family transcriptional regulator [Polynucleobacter sp. 24-46-87]